MIKTREEAGLPPVVDVTPKLPERENISIPTLATNNKDTPILATNQLSDRDGLESIGASAIDTMQVNESNNTNCDGKTDCDKLKRPSFKKPKGLTGNQHAIDFPDSLSKDSVQNDEGMVESSNGHQDSTHNRFSVLTPKEQVSANNIVIYGHFKKFKIHHERQY